MEKRKNGTYTSKETLAESRLTEYEKARREEIQAVQEQVDEMNENKDSNLEKIMAKINNGKELTQAEKDYLKHKNPTAYREVVETEQAQKAYEESLKKCRTKEDVQRLKNLEMGQRLSAVKEVMSNPNIPEGEKLGLVLKEYKKVKAALEVEKKFVESGAYDKLPTDAEYSEAIQEEAEAKKEELQGTSEKLDTEEQEVSAEEQEVSAENQEQGIMAQKMKAPNARQELDKDISEAQKKYEHAAKKMKDKGDPILTALYNIETAEDLMEFGDRFSNTLNIEA